MPTVGADTQPVAGKIAGDVFEAVMLPRMGMSRPDVLVGPRTGIDAAILSTGPGQVMAVTCDPLFVMPEYGWRRAAWFAVNIVASDLATTGLPPTFCALDLNLPLDMSDADLSCLWDGIHVACEEMGVAVVTGHTGRYEGCAFPMLGGCTMMGPGSAEVYVTPAMAGPGDALVVTKGPAIETAAQLAVLFEDRVTGALGPARSSAAGRLFEKMSVVQDAAVAVGAVGTRGSGITSMHDATERGLWGALVEVAGAASAGLLVDKERIPLLPEVAAICDLFEIDPYAASSEGTLVLTCGESSVEPLLRAFRSAGIPAARIGMLTEPDAGVRVATNGCEAPLVMPAVDPFWPALLAERRRRL